MTSCKTSEDSREPPTLSDNGTVPVSVNKQASGYYIEANTTTGKPSVGSATNSVLHPATFDIHSDSESDTLSGTGTSKTASEDIMLSDEGLANSQLSSAAYVLDDYSQALSEDRSHLDTQAAKVPTVTEDNTVEDLLPYDDMDVLPCELTCGPQFDYPQLLPSLPEDRQDTSVNRVRRLSAAASNIGEMPIASAVYCQHGVLLSFVHNDGLDIRYRVSCGECVTEWWRIVEKRAQ